MKDHTYVLSAEKGSPSPKKRKHEAKRQRDRRRDKTRVNIGTVAFLRWRELRRERDFKSDAEVASFLLNSYRQTTSASRPERPSHEKRSSAESCESACSENPFGMISSNEAEQETSSSVQSKSGKELRGKNAPKNKENGDREEEFSTSLSVGDGRYLVDLGSPSEIIVDEECILQLFESCRDCSGQCTVRKEVRGLKLVVHQECRFCESRSKWTNLPDADDDKDDGYFQIDGKESADGRSTATSLRSNIS